jgi:hypothetical protein
MYAFNPVYTLLKKEGAEAVEALLHAYQNDKRLTRTFDYSRENQVRFPMQLQHANCPGEHLYLNR